MEVALGLMGGQDKRMVWAWLDWRSVAHLFHLFHLFGAYCWIPSMNFDLFPLLQVYGRWSTENGLAIFDRCHMCVQTTYLQKIVLLMNRGIRCHTHVITNPQRTSSSTLTLASTTWSP
jgi:hypothetical protein